MIVLNVVIYIITVALGHIIPPFTSVPLQLAAVGKYGFLYTLLFTIIGNILGAVVAFYIARHYGWRVIEMLFDKEKAKKARYYVSHYTFWHMTWSRIVFASIFDILSFASGLTKITIDRFIISSIISTTPVVFFILLFGNNLNLNYAFIAWLSMGLLVISVVIMVRHLFKATKIHELKLKSS